jgi:Mg-chelatase subunit ChlD
MKWMIRTVALALTGLVMSGALAQPPRTAAPPAIKPSKPVDDERGRVVERDAAAPAIDAALVTIPIVAKSRAGQYVADLTKEELTVVEDGAPQQISSFTTVNVPVHVVLLLDTSSSTREHLSALQRAAIAFVEQLSAADKVKLISFNDSVRDWNDFTADKKLLRSVIGQIEPGSGTKVYDAIDSALNVLRPITGKKAVVIFSDAYDWRSDSATFEGSLRNLEESGVIVYPIRFETRAEAERVARQQDVATNGADLPTSETVRNTTTTPPTVPSNEPDQPGRSTPDPMSIIFGRPGARTGRDPRETRPDPRDSGEEIPKSDPRGPKVVKVPRAPEKPTDPFPRTPDPAPPVAEAGSKSRQPTDPIKASLDQAYLTADNYLNALADRSGGQVYRADTIALAPRAFAAIAAELRTQYLLGYYPTNQNYDNAYRKLEVRTSRSDVTIRARPGYRMRRGN